MIRKYWWWWFGHAKDNKEKRLKIWLIVFEWWQWKSLHMCVWSIKASKRYQFNSYPSNFRTLQKLVPQRYFGFHWCFLKWQISENLTWLDYTCIWLTFSHNLDVLHVLKCSYTPYTSFLVSSYLPRLKNLLKWCKYDILKWTIIYFFVLFLQIS